MVEESWNKTAWGNFVLNTLSIVGDQYNIEEASQLAL
jgi:hypothetical protein